MSTVLTLLNHYFPFSSVVAFDLDLLEVGHALLLRPEDGGLIREQRAERGRGHGVRGRRGRRRRRGLRRRDHHRGGRGGRKAPKVN